MDPYYLGYVEFIHEDLWGRVRPLALLKKRSVDDAWVIGRPCKPDELGGSGLVFWPKIPRDQDGLTRHYVRFKVEPNQRARDPERECDEFVVAEEWRNGAVRRVATLGMPVLPEDRVSGPDRFVSSSVGLRPEEIVYRRRMKDTLIDGPWRAVKSGDSTRLCLQPLEDGFVVEHRIDFLGPETFHIWDDDRQETHVVLLAEPAKEGGRLIDLIPTSGLADWLTRVLKRDKALLSSLDRASPGWRGRLGELLGTSADPVQRALDQSRLSNLSAALNALANDEARLADLAELPRFKEILDAAIGREVAARSDEIRTAAQEETRSYVGQQKREREQEKAKVDREKQTLRCVLDRVRIEVSDIERERDEARAKVAADESTIRAAADYLVESRERIIRDFSAFHVLIENARASGDDSANGHHRVPTNVLQVPLSTRIEIKPDGPAIDDLGVFISKRLSPTLACWGAKAMPEQAEWLHAALLACRWVVTPCPSWGVAYAEAIGAHARHRVVAVEPTWLAFSDAWSGEVGTFWREAIVNPDILHLLIFADADRALVQCWARPLLDVISGLRRELPSGECWPTNLRLIACPSPDEATLPVPDWVLSHWAGIEATSGASFGDWAIITGYVSFAAWASWIARPDDAARPSVGPGVAARERSALTGILQQMHPNRDPEDADRVARKVREAYARSVFVKGARE